MIGFKLMVPWSTSGKVASQKIQTETPPVSARRITSSLRHVASHQRWDVGSRNPDTTGLLVLRWSSASQYRAVVTDINLVGQLDGWEVARAARENEPAMPVIYMTGTHGEEWASKGVPNSVLLAKPFAPAQLV